MRKAIAAALVILLLVILAGCLFEMDTPGIKLKIQWLRRPGMIRGGEPEPVMTTNDFLPSSTNDLKPLEKK